MSKIWVALALLILTCPVLAETRELERDDGTVLVYHLNRPSAPNYPLVVILQGSECLRVSDKYRDLVARLNDSGSAVLRVEKPGLRADTPVGECPPEYLQLNTIDRRVLDLLTVLAEVRREESHWNQRLGLAGGSEGAMVAGLAAPLLPETEALLLLSSGGGESFASMVKGSIAESMRTSGAPESQISEHLAKIERQWEDVLRQPLPSLEWGSDGKLSRNTYMWWAQALPKTLYRPLLKLSIPIRVYQGKADSSVPQSTALRLQQRFQDAGKDNLSLVFYEGEHLASPVVLQEAFDWLQEQLASP